MNAQTREELLALQRHTFGYFIHEANPANGLILDNTRYGSPASIAAVGFALSCYAVAAERGCLTRQEAALRAAATLRFLAKSPQGPEADSTGHRGFYYHFLNMKTGRRAHGCELSAMDTAILMAGALSAAAYFGRATGEEREIRELADLLFRRVEWAWAADDGLGISHGWTPETGFLPYHWTGYNEGLILYALALGSPTHAAAAAAYDAWLATYEWKRIYGEDFVYAAPLFTHQLSHLWIDFRGISDRYMSRRGIDYFENSRRATLVQQRYAIDNPRGFKGYGRWSWGITASEGPGNSVRTVGGVRRRFYDYCARGVPWGPDDGTLSPWAVVASLPFAPEIALPTIQSLVRRYPHIRTRYGLLCSFNPTFRTQGSKGWIAQGYLGLDQGPVVLMIENYLSGLLWELMRGCSHLVRGLERAGFRGGWLDSSTESRDGEAPGRKSSEGSPAPSR